MNFTNQPPDWEVQGVEPPEELRKTKGWLAGYKPPASYFNWFFNKCYLCLKELQENLGIMSQILSFTKKVWRDEWRS